MTPAPKCEHCKGQFAFGIFRLTYLKGGHTVKRSLCADCGFNITNFRTVKHYQFEREVVPPTGGPYTVNEDVLSQKFVYSESVLLETYMGTILMAKEAQKRDEELAAQRAAYEEAKRNTPVSYGRGRRGAAREPQRVLVVEKAAPAGAVLSNQADDVSSVGGAQVAPTPAAPRELLIVRR